MHMLWRSVNNLGPAPLVDRVLLKQAHVSCTGNARDEKLIDEIAHIVYRVSGASRTDRLKRKVATSQQLLKVSGREYAHADFALPAAAARNPRARLRDARRERFRQSIPDALPPEIALAMEQACRPSQHVRPLPVNVDHLHARQRRAADSVIHTCLAGWLASEDGVAWQQERASLYTTEQAPSGVASSDEEPAD